MTAPQMFSHTGGMVLAESARRHNPTRQEKIVTQRAT